MVAPAPDRDALVDTLAVFEDPDDPYAPLATTDVAETLGCSRRTAYNRLDALAERGYVETKKVGSRARVWWRSPAGSDDDAAGSGAARRDERSETLSRLVDTIPGMVYRGRHEPGRPMEFVGEGSVALTGYESADLVSGELEFESDVVHPDDVEAVRETVQSGLEEDGQFAIEYRIRTAGGETRRVHEFARVADDAASAAEIEGLVTACPGHEERERELERRRERLEELDDVNEVAREITAAVIEQSTREEVGRAVCEQLAGSDAYEFAWIGDVESGSDAVRVRTAAGPEDYLDGLDVSVDPDQSRRVDPTARALRTAEMTVVRDVSVDRADEPWRDRAAASGFRSVAATPITSEGTVYGVLTTYSRRPEAFVGVEREVIGQLGEVVGHAINAIERKQALMSDEVVELEVRVEDALVRMDGSDRQTGRISFDQVIPLGDDEHLVYGTATGSTFAAVETLVDRIPHFGGVTVLSEGTDGIRYELQLDEPPVLSAIAANGGRITSATIEDGDYRMTVELPPGLDVRRIVDAVRDTYPDGEILAQRRTTRRDASSERIRRALVDELTDRQRTALQAAYYAGFFEWPRDSTGEEIAASMGIGPSTFHQHLRTGQRKLLGALFAAGTPPD